MPVCVVEFDNGSGVRTFVRSGTVNNSTPCELVMLTNLEYDQIYHAVLVSPPAPVVPLDPVQVGAFFSFGLATVVACWYASHCVGAVVGFLRRA